MVHIITRDRFGQELITEESGALYLKSDGIYLAQSKKDDKYNNGDKALGALCGDGTVCIVGAGLGNTIEQVLLKTSIVDVIERSPLVEEYIRANYPDVNLIMKDAIEYFKYCSKRYFNIISDTSVSGIGWEQMFQKPYFHMVKKHLREGGVFVTRTDVSCDAVVGVLREVFRNVITYKDEVFGDVFYACSDGMLEEVNLSEFKLRLIKGV